MESYMHWLLQIEGQHFLDIFFVYAIVVVMGARFINRNDGTQNSLLKEQEMPDAIAAAFLRGGWQAVVETVIFSLLERRVLEINLVNSKQSFIHITHDERLTPLEQLIMRKLLAKQSIRKLYRDSEFENEIESYLRPVTIKLEQLRLLKGEKLRRRSSSVFWVSTLLLVFLAGPKLYLGLSRDKPVLFLVMLLLIAIVMLWFILIRDRSTTLGKLYWKSLKNRFQWAKMDFQTRGDSSNLEPAYFIALFGPGVLSATMFHEDFQKASGVQSSGGGCSGFYGGCSGGSSSDGGCGGGSSSDGGCGGGGCGGGGGGCGGCGGD